ncbi:hypothetical protein ACE01N_01520 [Saccharicrinis sp. FJH2]|uniref:hypothetical protein n=1 Tax=Saccharicrinis sp. FJH65 TaxID=3344659 RepID=UPI0035F4E02B
MKPYLLLSLLIFSTTAFGKKVIETHSKWTPDNSFPVKTDAFDKKSGISLAVSNDDKNIYLTFVTSDQKLQIALMKQGFKLYFDTVKQKNKACYLSYANEVPTPMQRGKGMQQGNRNVMGQGLEMGNNATRPVQQQPGNTMLPPFRIEIIKGDYSKAECNGIDYDLKFQKTVFSASFELDTSNVMICRAVIPLRIINTSELTAIPNLSIGLEITDNYKQGPGGNRQAQHGGGMGMSSGRGGGRMQGMGGSPGGRGGMGGPPQGGMRGGPGGISSSSAKRLAKFWFHTTLAEHP